MHTPLLSTPLQVITSMRLQQDPDKLLLIASTRLPQRTGCPAQLQVIIPKLDGYFTGTGKSERHSKQLPTMSASLRHLCRKPGGTLAGNTVCWWQPTGRPMCAVTLLISKSELGPAALQVTC